MPHKDPQDRAAYVERNKEKIRQYQKLYYLKHADRLKSTSREWALAHPEAAKSHSTKYRLKKFDLTEDGYLDLLRKQNNKCAICGRTSEEISKRSPKRLAVDHDHKAGIVRGLLCYHCNVGLGHFNDSVERLKIAIAYLSQR